MTESCSLGRKMIGRGRTNLNMNDSSNVRAYDHNILAKVQTFDGNAMGISKMGLKKKISIYGKQQYCYVVILVWITPLSQFKYILTNFIYFLYDLPSLLIVNIKKKKYYFCLFEIYIAIQFWFSQIFHHSQQHVNII